MVNAGNEMPEELFTVKPVSVFCKNPKPLTEPPPRLSVSVWLLPTAALKVSTPLPVVSVKLLSTSTVSWKVMLPPPLLMVEAPAMVTGVAKTIGSFVVLRLTPTLMSPPTAFAVSALNVDCAVTKPMEFADVERTWDLYIAQNPGRVLPLNAEVNMPGAETVVRTLVELGEVRDNGRGAAAYVDERYQQEAAR